jgi:hypothetical protein
VTNLYTPEESPGIYGGIIDGAATFSSTGWSTRKGLHLHPQLPAEEDTIGRFIAENLLSVEGGAIVTVTSTNRFGPQFLAGFPLSAVGVRPRDDIDRP